MAQIDEFDLEQIGPPITSGLPQWTPDSIRAISKFRMKTSQAGVLDDHCTWRFQVPPHEFWRPLWYKFYGPSINRITGNVVIPVIRYDQFSPTWVYDPAGYQVTKVLEAGGLAGTTQYMHYYDTPYSGFPTYPYLFPTQKFNFVVYAGGVWNIDSAAQLEMDLIRIRDDAPPEVFTAALSVFRDRT